MKHHEASKNITKSKDNKQYHKASNKTANDIKKIQKQQKTSKDIKQHHETSGDINNMKQQRT